MLVEQHRTVLQYWQSDCGHWGMLQDIAIRVFSMSSSAAASERNFSLTGFIHNKQRNRLSDEKVKKLVYIKTNAAQLHGDVGHHYEDDVKIENVTQTLECE